ncbi:MAG: DUF4892 domain-containing protein [Halieaceae bacterium]|nr:DUF4892 domain-containing protein [Halieaceae bacterium]
MLRVLGLAIVLCSPAVVGQEEALPAPQALLDRVDSLAHSRLIADSEGVFVGYEIGLGAIQKIQGAWRFKKSERLDGHLWTYTWQIINGFSSLEVFEALVARIEATGENQLLFSCEGRRCGQGVQWANRIFGQRILYGREDLQRYRVYAIKHAGDYRLLLYSSARSADRQHLHAELLHIGEKPR